MGIDWPYSGHKSKGILRTLWVFAWLIASFVAGKNKKRNHGAFSQLSNGKLMLDAYLCCTLFSSMKMYVTSPRPFPPCLRPSPVISFRPRRFPMVSHGSDLSPNPTRSHHGWKTKTWWLFHHFSMMKSECFTILCKVNRSTEPCSPARASPLGFHRWQWARSLTFHQAPSVCRNMAAGSNIKPEIHDWGVFHRPTWSDIIILISEISEWLTSKIRIQHGLI